MADVQTNSSRKGVRKSKKLSTRVDLTPMVDLGFLLITFFIFTSALAKPVAMRINMPDDGFVDNPMLLSEDKLLTLLVLSGEQLVYYPGMFNGQLKETNFLDFRVVIAEKKAQLKRTSGSGDLTVLIKASDEAYFKSIVNCLDEMTINGVSTFMLLDPTPQELAAVKNTQ